MKSNPTINIVISTRGNFYKNASEDYNEKGNFADFCEYGLIPLCQNDIIDYLHSRLIDSNKFMVEVNLKKLKDLLSIPFYLICIVEIYKISTALPQRNELMEKLIKQRFNKDIHKYITTTPPEDFEYEVNISLQH